MPSSPRRTSASAMADHRQHPAAAAAATPGEPSTASRSNSNEDLKEGRRLRRTRGAGPRRADDRLRLHVDGPELDGWYIAKIVLRSFSLAITVPMVALYPLLVGMYQVDLMLMPRRYAPVWDIAANASFAIYVILTSLWDFCEFITMCCRKGYGIAPKAHIGIELTLFFCGCGALSLMVLTIGITSWRMVVPVGNPGPMEASAVVAMMATVVTIRFVLFVRNAADKCKGRGLTPRIMYLQTGQPVVVMRRPYPPPPTMELSRMETKDVCASPTVTTNTAAAAAEASCSAPTSHTTPGGAPTTTRQPQQLRTGAASGSCGERPTGPDSPFSPAGVAEPMLPPQPPPPSQHQLYHHQSGHRPPQPFPRRKPVLPPRRGSAVSSYEGPRAPPPDYEPDEGERRRAERGEAQAQWMTLEAMGLRGPASGKGRPTPEGSLDDIEAAAG